MVGEEDPATNPFGHAVSNLKKQREAFVKQKKIEAEKEQAALAKEQQELAKKREEQLVEAKSVLVMDARAAIERIKPEDYIEPGSISFTSEAFAWFAEDGMEGFRFAPEFLAVTTNDRVVRLYDPMTGMQIKSINDFTLPDTREEADTGDEVFPGYEGDEDEEVWVHKVAFSADGKLLASARDGTWEVWDLKTEMLVRRLQQNEEKSIHSLAFSPTEHTVATLDYDGELLLWDVDSGGCEYLETDEAFGTEDSDCLAFSPDGTKIAAGNAYGQLRIWDVETGEHQTVEVNDDPITTLTFRNCSKGLAVGTEGEYFILNLKDQNLSNGKDWRGGSNLQCKLNGGIFWFNKPMKVSYCKEFDLCAVNHKRSQKISISQSYGRERIHRIQIPNQVQDFSLSPSPHPDLSIIFTEVKFMLNAVGFILSTDDGIHFALSWESES